MIKHDRPVAERARTALLAGACLSFLVLSGCGGMRTVFGLDQVGPDEFAVESRAPLLIPPDFNLRPPQPGATRPNEATASDRARQVIDTAGPGEPGKRASSALRASTDGLSPTPGSQLDPNQQVQASSMAGKLLSSGDSAPGATEAGRETTPLKGVY